MELNHENCLRTYLVPALQGADDPPLTAAVGYAKLGEKRRKQEKKGGK